MRKDNRFSLIERSAMTFESFLGREFGNRFYSEEFLAGISSRRLEIRARMARSGGLAITFATIIAFFDLIAGSAISYSGVTLQITRDLTPIVALLAAAAFLQLTFAFIDDQILFRILMKLGARIGIYNFALMLVDKAAIDLWSDALTPRYFGPKSGVGQKAAFLFVSIFALSSFLALYLYAPAMISVVTYETFADPEARFVAKGICTLACVVTFSSFLVAFFSFWRFRFQAADWVESTNEPTAEYAARMRAELAAETPQSDQKP